MVGAGQFAGTFAKLFQLHPGVSEVRVTDLRARAGRRARRPATAWRDLRRRFDALLALRRRRGGDLHPALDPRPAGRAGPAGRQARLLRRADGDHRRGDRSDHRGRPGDRAHLHDGRDQPLQPGDRLRPAASSPRTPSAGSSTPRATTCTTWTSASTPPTSTAAARTGRPPPATRRCSTRPTRSAACSAPVPAHAVSVSAIGVVDERGDGVFDRRSASSTTTSPTRPRCSSWPTAGSCGSTSCAGSATRRTSASPGSATSAPRPASSSSPPPAVWQDKQGVTDISEQIDSRAADVGRRPVAGRRRPRTARRVHLRPRPGARPSRLPDEFRGVPNGHEGSHHFLVDDFARAVETGTLPPVNAWTAARFTVPGIVAHQSALQGGVRLPVPDFGDAPERLVAADRDRGMTAHPPNPTSAYFQRHCRPYERPRYRPRPVQP